MEHKGNSSITDKNSNDDNHKKILVVDLGTLPKILDEFKYSKDFEIHAFADYLTNCNIAKIGELQKPQKNITVHRSDQTTSAFTNLIWWLSKKSDLYNQSPRNFIIASKNKLARQLIPKLIEDGHDVIHVETIAELNKAIN